jgi:steroid delta-isomerase-like uncharacterized protein
MAEDNKALVQRWAEAVNRQDVDAALACYAPSYTDHTPGHDGGVTQVRQALLGMFAAFPDLRYTSEDVIAEGDRLVERFSSVGTHEGELMGAAPTGNKVTVSGINIYRVADGKIVERWAQIDDLGMMQQLGLSPTPHHTH